MFDEVPADQLHQFIAAASRASVVPFPLSFSTSSSSSSLHLHHHHHHHHHGSSPFPDSFDPFSSTTTSQQVQQPHQLLHSLPQQKINEEKEENRSSSSSLVGMNLEVVQRERLIQKDPAWSLDELLALLRIRSSLENWFPELTWEHVSRYKHVYMYVCMRFFFNMLGFTYDKLFMYIRVAQLQCLFKSS